MAEIGFLSRQMDGDDEVFVGELRTLELAINLALRPTGEPSNSRRPSHHIYAKSAQGRLTQIGSAWTKEMKQPARFGETFLSLTLDDPSFSHPLNVSAFKAPNSDDYTITWRRRQDRNTAVPSE